MPHGVIPDLRRQTQNRRAVPGVIGAAFLFIHAGDLFEGWGDFLYFLRFYVSVTPTADMSQNSYIFLCNDQTEQECLERNLFGGGEKYKARVKGLEKGDTLFLYNYRSKKLHGIFKASTDLQENISEDAWKGEFPWQVRVERIEEHKPISREDIRSLLKFDRAGRPSSRFDQEISAALVQLFRNEDRIKTYDDELRYVTKDGHRVRSKAEQEIDNWLYSHGLAHGYEVAIPRAKLCDFEVPTKHGIFYIEYWGLEDENYLKNKEQKLELYKKNNLKLISLNKADIKNLDQILSSELS